METKKEYIEVAALRKTFEETCADMFGDLDGDFFAESGFSRNAVEEIITSVPKADIAEVVHGRWITDDKDVTYCGNCRHIDDYASVHNYCPMCGAKMNLED